MMVREQGLGGEALYRHVPLSSSLPIVARRSEGGSGQRREGHLVFEVSRRLKVSITSQLTSGGQDLHMGCLPRALKEGVEGISP